MGWLIFAAMLAYFIMAVVIARRYFLRRHGLSARSGDVGAVVAGMVGLLWPISLLLPGVRRPTLCSDHGHVLERNRIREEIRAVEALREAEGR